MKSLQYHKTNVQKKKKVMANNLKVTYTFKIAHYTVCNCFNLSIYLSVCLSVCLAVCLPIYLSIYLSILRCIILRSIYLYLGLV